MKGTKLYNLFREIIDVMVEEERLESNQGNFIKNVIMDFMWEKDRKLSHSLESLFEYDSHLIREDIKLKGFKKIEVKQ